VSAEPRWRIALTSWLAVYPTITAVGALTLPFTGDLPWAARTFVITTIMVPLVVYVTGPAVRALLGAGVSTVIRSKLGRRAETRDIPQPRSVASRGHVES
jgi:antibiotic biosynthesis monooxygenase (ABM) superfamily enzyme